MPDGPPYPFVLGWTPRRMVAPILREGRQSPALPFTARGFSFGELATSRVPPEADGFGFQYWRWLRWVRHVRAYAPAPGRKQRICVCPSVPMYGQTTAGPNLFGSVTTASSGTTIHSPLSRTR
jgi:hypothetical protein